jgi:hypothetical protein
MGRGRGEVAPWMHKQLKKLTRLGSVGGWPQGWIQGPIGTALHRYLFVFLCRAIRGITRIWKEGRQKNLSPWRVIIFGEKLPP